MERLEERRYGYEIGQLQFEFIVRPSAQLASSLKQLSTTLRKTSLDETGICVVPGSGFGQKEGEWHYRLTCLCPGVEEYVGKLETFHEGFVKKGLNII